VVDYDFASGEGTLRIRDLGSVIEFWVRAGYTNFYWNGLDFSFTANSNTANVSINYSSGADWQKVGSATVNSTQTVTFRLLTATGTSSLGGPTTVSKYIDRGSIPDPPSAVTLSSITSTSMLASFTDGDNGGLSITNRQIAYNKSNTTSGATIVTSDRSTSLTGLSPKTTYYVWARTFNSKGWSGWSAVRSAKTLAVPDAPAAVTFTNIKQSSVDAAFKDNANNGASITNRQIIYNTTNNPTAAGAVTVTSDGSTSILNLDAGMKYYFWARTYNSVGWSAYSAGSSVQLLAGAWVKVNGVWVRAVPYVRVAGVWKVAEMYVNQGGYWKQSAQ
jgi:hypothetical protein